MGNRVEPPGLEQLFPRVSGDRVQPVVDARHRAVQSDQRQAEAGLLERGPEAFKSATQTGAVEVARTPAPGWKAEPARGFPDDSQYSSQGSPVLGGQARSIRSIGAPPSRKAVAGRVAMILRREGAREADHADPASGQKPGADTNRQMDGKLERHPRRPFPASCLD
jgi:hypothetical protein